MKKTCFLIFMLFILISIYLLIKYDSQSNNQTQIIDYQNYLIDLNKNYDSHPNENSSKMNPMAPVNYYMFTLSWSPGFCQETKIKNHNTIPPKHQFQCLLHPQERWIIHGLWPQNKNAKQIIEHPSYCRGDLPPLKPKIMQPFLKDSPGFALLQHEWEKHGTCAFKTAEQYFNKQQELFNSLNLPNQKFKPQQLRKIITTNNPLLKKVHFNILKNEIQICYNLKWEYIDCPNYQ